MSWASAASTVLDSWYDPATGLYRTTGWWNSAHALEADLAVSELRGGDRGLRRAATTHARNRADGFVNDFYDDEGWWALTWVHAYDLTHEQRYLKTAKALFADMAASWGGSCGGGIWWSKDRTYKNAVANEVFIALAAKLALRTEGREAARFRQWALRGWNWFAHSGMLNSSDLINDGLDSACRNNGRTTWTYNQGVILGALADLYRLTEQERYLVAAGRIADAAITALSGPDGVLHEPCEPKCGKDGPQFKGIFMRNLAALHEVAPSPRYVDFALHNASSIWRFNRSPANRFGLIWSGPFDSADAARQSSALACLNAAARMLASSGAAPSRSAPRAGEHGPPKKEHPRQPLLVRTQPCLEGPERVPGLRTIDEVDDRTRHLSCTAISQQHRRRAL
jgi:predicted alpha-1,6-mannanase (GH76 family)